MSGATQVSLKMVSLDFLEMSSLWLLEARTKTTPRTTHLDHGSRRPTSISVWFIVQAWVPQNFVSLIIYTNSYINNTDVF